jgi:predicted glycosyltransferase
MVRCQQIGLALSERHQVSILDGGRTVPFPPALEPVRVPGLARVSGELRPLDDALSLYEAFVLRREQLQDAISEQCPDVVLVEHFPFSKWELAGEIENLLDYTRQVNPAVKIVASLRDVSLRTRHENSREYEKQVLRWLHRCFDGLLVHADPALNRLSDYFPASADIGIPVFHTGIVAAQVEPLDPQLKRRQVGNDNYVVASAGGGADRGRLLSRVVQAWRELSLTGAISGHRLLLFSGLEGVSHTLGELIASEPSITDMGFDPQFRRWLEGAVLSISCAGYNTCADLLATRTPALLVPNPAMSDQGERARLMAGRETAVIVPSPSEEEPLLTLIPAHLGRGKTTHTIRLDGAGQSADCIERWCSGLPGQ